MTTTFPSERATGQRRRVMLVDDDRSVLQLIEEWLTAAGYDVEVFTQFEAALWRMKDGMPDVLITDVRLGAFNGLQLVVYAKMVAPSLTAIVLTGFEDPVLRKDTQAAGGHYLLKPVSATDIMSVLRATDTDPAPRSLGSAAAKATIH